MSQQIKSFINPQEYLRLERQSEYKSEYLNGEIFAMSGARREHNLISTNISSSLHGQLKGRPCEVYAVDMRIKVRAVGLYTYPDVAVVCDEPEFEDDFVDTLLNPTLLVEVSSPSTERYDRIAKTSYYRAIDSLAEHLLGPGRNSPKAIRSTPKRTMAAVGVCDYRCRGQSFFDRMYPQAQRCL